MIFFDLHGTLIHKTIKPDQALAEALLQYTARWESDDKTDRIKKACKIYSHAIAKYQRNKTSGVSSNIRKSAIKRAIANLPFPEDESTVAALDRELVLIMQSNERFAKKAIAVLRRLKKHYKLALISNGNESKVRAKLRRYRLAPIFLSNAIFVSSSLGKGKGKPNSAIFRHALSRMHIKPEQAIMVGDSWHKDIAGAANCGIDAVWMNPTSKPEPDNFANVRVTSVRDISELLDIL